MYALELKTDRYRFEYCSELHFKVIDLEIEWWLESKVVFKEDLDGSLSFNQFMEKVRTFLNNKEIDLEESK